MVHPIPIIIPIPNTRKGLITFLAVLIGLCLIGAFLVYYFWAQDQKRLEEYGQPDFHTVAADELDDGMIVKGTIGLSFGFFAETYETRLGIRTSDDSESLYYAIPVYEVDQEGYYNIRHIITFHANPRHFDIMEDIEEYTYSDTMMPVELVVENAVVRKLSPEIEQYFFEWADDPFFYENGSFIDWCAEYGILGTDDPAEIRAKLIPYTIYETAQAGSELWPVLFFVGCAVGLLIIMLVLIYRKKPIKGVNETDPVVNQGDFQHVRDIQNNGREM